MKFGPEIPRWPVVGTNPTDELITSGLLKITGPNLLGPHFSVSLSNQAVWPVIFGLTGAICARARNLQANNELSQRALIRRGAKAGIAGSIFVFRKLFHIGKFSFTSYLPICENNVHAARGSIRKGGS